MQPWQTFADLSTCLGCLKYTWRNNAIRYVFSFIYYQFSRYSSVATRKTIFLAFSKLPNLWWIWLPVLVSTSNWFIISCPHSNLICICMKALADFFPILLDQCFYEGSLMIKTPLNPGDAFCHAISFQGVNQLSRCSIYMKALLSVPRFHQDWPQDIELSSKFRI